jgi:hypothetical protein
MIMVITNIANTHYKSVSSHVASQLRRKWSNFERWASTSGNILFKKQ